MLEKLYDWPTVGMVISTYASVPYIHMHLESARRHYPAVPILVVDDASHQTLALLQLCDQYGAELRTNTTRMGHVRGDISAFVHGGLWARARRLHMWAKCSRRFLPLTDWVSGLRQLAIDTQWPCYSSWCDHWGFGFRTEFMALHTKGFLPHIPDLIRRVERNDMYLPEAMIHHISQHMTRDLANEANQKWREANPTDRSYGHWPFMPTNRTVKGANCLWHCANPHTEYHSWAMNWGLPYSAQDFEDCNRT